MSVERAGATEIIIREPARTVELIVLTPEYIQFELKRVGRSGWLDISGVKPRKRLAVVWRLAECARSSPNIRTGP